MMEERKRYFKLLSLEEAKRKNIPDVENTEGKIYGIDYDIYEKLSKKLYEYKFGYYQKVDIYYIPEELIRIVNLEDINYKRYNIKLRKIKDRKIIDFLSKEKKENNRSPTEVLRVLYNKIYGENNG